MGIQFLEKSYRSLEAHTETLERQRREVMHQVERGQGMVRQEERLNSEMRNKLERMRREHAAAANGRREAYLREQRLREMQSDYPKSVDGRHVNSWAKSLLSGAPGEISELTVLETAVTLAP